MKSISEYEAEVRESTAKIASLLSQAQTLADARAELIAKCYDDHGLCGTRAAKQFGISQSRLWQILNNKRPRPNATPLGSIVGAIQYS